MKNEDLTKLARWIIPGWTAILTLLVFIACDVVSTPPNAPHLFKDLGEFVGLISGVDAVLVALLVAASGVPIGFLIYQFYFFVRWNSPFSRDGFFALIPGRIKDLERAVAGLTEQQISLGQQWREDIVNHPLYSIDHGFRWRYLEPLFLQACSEFDSKFSGLSIYSRHRYLHEVVHTLGASIGAAYFGFAGYLILKFVKEPIFPPYYLLTIFLVISVFFLLLHYEDKERFDLVKQRGMIQARQNTQDEKQGKKTAPILRVQTKKVGFSYLSSQLLATLSLIHFFANPVLGQVSHNEEKLVLKFFVGSLFLGAWGAAQHALPKKYVLGNIIWALGSLVVSLLFYLLSQSVLVDWGFFSAMSVFLVLNLVLFLNRRNANEDMLALENYTLHRYLSNEQPVLKTPPEALTAVEE